MSNKALTFWLVLLIAWNVVSYFGREANKETRNRGVIYRQEKFAKIDGRLDWLEAELNRQHKYTNKTIIPALNELGKLSHSH